jgi:hypothetical protein
LAGAVLGVTIGTLVTKSKTRMSHHEIKKKIQWSAQILTTLWCGQQKGHMVIKVIVLRGIYPFVVDNEAF